MSWIRFANLTLIAAVIGIVWLLPLHAQEKMPSDVKAFIEQRTLCDHFREEPWPEGRTPEEQERRAFLTRQMGHYCGGSDASLQSLRERYRDNRMVIQELGRFETSIEAQ